MVRSENETGVYFTTKSLFFARMDGCPDFVLYARAAPNIQDFGSFLTHNEDWCLNMRDGVVFVACEQEAAELLPQLEDAYQDYLADCIDREAAAEDRRLRGFI